MARFSRRHYQLVSTSDTPEAQADRLHQRAVMETIERERIARYPLITADNVAEVLAWQERRFRELSDRR